MTADTFLLSKSYVSNFIQAVLCFQWSVFSSALIAGVFTLVAPEAHFHVVLLHIWCCHSCTLAFPFDKIYLESTGPASIYVNAAKHKRRLPCLQTVKKRWYLLKELAIWKKKPKTKQANKNLQKKKCIGIKAGVIVNVTETEGLCGL